MNNKNNELNKTELLCRIKWKVISIDGKNVGKNEAYYLKFNKNGLVTVKENRRIYIETWSWDSKQEIINFEKYFDSFNLKNLTETEFGFTSNDRFYRCEPK